MPQGGDGVVGDALHHEASCHRGETLLLLADVTRGDINDRVGGKVAL